eukprot:6731000-Prymnesium_polylepis.1
MELLEREWSRLLGARAPAGRCLMGVAGTVSSMSSVEREKTSLGLSELISHEVRGAVSDLSIDDMTAAGRCGCGLALPCGEKKFRRSVYV